MKKLLKNQDGVVLVTALMLTLISLTIIMALMYMITQNIKQTAMHKSYKTALEASYGGSEIVIKEIIPQIFQSYDNPSLITNLESSFSMISLAAPTSLTCLRDKFSKSADSWDAACSQHLDPKKGPDITFRLQATGGRPYTVYTKIVDTVVGNSDQSGLQLEGEGTAQTQATITPQHFPFVYRVEIQGERSTNATEQANLSVVYSY